MAERKRRAATAALLGALACTGLVVVGSLLIQAPSEEPDEPLRAHPSDTQRRVATQTPALAFTRGVDLRDGDRLRYRFEFRSESDVNLRRFLTAAGFGKEAEQQIADRFVPASSVLTGILNLRVFQDANPGANVIARFEGLAMDSTVEVDLLPYECPFGFRVNQNGIHSEFYYASGVSRGHRTLVNAITSGLQLAFPDNATHRWTATETDAYGTFEANYQTQSCPLSDQVCVVREKQAYSTDADVVDPPEPATGRIEVSQSRGQWTFPSEPGWIESSKIDERVEIRDQEGALAATYDNRWRFSLLERSEHNTSADAYRQAQRAVEACRFSKLASSEADEALRGMSGADALRRFLALLTSGSRSDAHLAENFMLSYLRSNPEAARWAIGVINSESELLGRDARLLLWRLVAETGNTDAQEAMTLAMSDPELSPKTRFAAVLNASSIKNAEPFVIEALATVGLEDAGNPSLPGATAGQVRSTALFAIGALGGESQTTLAARELATTVLTDTLESAESAQEVGVALTAIGNTRDPKFVPTLVEYSASDAPDVRANAYRSLAVIGGEESASEFIAGVSSEPSRRVRAQSYQAMQYFAPRESLMVFARHELSMAQSVSEADVLERFLVRHQRQFPENARAIAAYRTRRQ